MFFFEGVKTPVYIVSRSVAENGVTTYGDPTRYDVSCLTVLPVSASADLREVGTRFTGYKQMTGDPEYLAAIKVLDKAYVDAEPPLVADLLASEADYIVHRIITTPTCTTVILRLVGEMT